MIVGPLWLVKTASSEQSRPSGRWCISTLTVDPASTEQRPVVGAAPALHARSYLSHKDVSSMCLQNGRYPTDGSDHAHNGHIASGFANTLVDLVNVADPKLLERGMSVDAGSDDERGDERGEEHDEPSVERSIVDGPGHC